MAITPQGKRHTLILATIAHKYTYTSRRGEVLSGVSPYAKLELSIRDNRCTRKFECPVDRIEVVTDIQLAKKRFGTVVLSLCVATLFWPFHMNIHFLLV